MRDVIQKVIMTEAEAKQLLESARIEKERILSDAQKKAEEITARILRESRVEADKIVSAAIEEGEKEKQEKLAGITSEIENQIRIEQSLKQRLVENTVRFICGQK